MRPVQAAGGGRGSAGRPEVPQSLGTGSAPRAPPGRRGPAPAAAEPRRERGREGSAGTAGGRAGGRGQAGTAAAAGHPPGPASASGGCAGGERGRSVPRPAPAGGSGPERPALTPSVPALPPPAPAQPEPPLPALSQPDYRSCTSSLHAPRIGQDNCHDAQPGDLIEIDRGFYQHWALYMGDGYVIHVAPVDKELPSWLRNMAFVLARKGMVKKELLKKVVGNDDWRVNNEYDRLYTPLSVEEIICSAKERIDKEVSYGLLTNNCEHFVTELRYGKRRSDQVRKVVAYTAAAAIVASVIIISPSVASAIGKLWRGKTFHKILYI